MGTDIVIGTDPSQNKQLQIEHEHLLNNRYQEVEEESKENLNEVISVFRFPKRHANHDFERLETELESFIQAKLKLDNIGGGLDLSYADSEEDIVNFDITEHVFDQDLFDSKDFLDSSQKIQIGFIQETEIDNFDSSDKIEQVELCKSSTLQQEYDSLFSLDIANYKSFIDNKSDKISQELYIHKRNDLMIVFKKFLISADRIDRIRKQFYKSNLYKNNVRNKESFKYKYHVHDKGEHVKSTKDIEFALQRASTFKDNAGLAPIIFPEIIKDTHGKLIEEKLDEIFQHLLCDIFKYFYTHELEIAKEHKEVNDCAKSFIEHIKWRDKNDISAISHPNKLESNSCGTQTEFVFSNVWDLADIRVADYFDLDNYKPHLTKVTLVKHSNETIVRHFEYIKHITTDDHGLDKDNIDLRHKKSELEMKLRKMENEIHERNKILKSLNQKIEIYQINILNELWKETMPTANEMYSTKKTRDLMIAYEQGYAHGYGDGSFKERLIKSSNSDEFNEGLEQGWSIGFNDGTCEGVRIVFADAKKKGIDLLSKPIDDYLTKKYRFSNIKHIIKKKNFHGFENIEKAVHFRGVFEEFSKISDSKKIKIAEKEKNKIIKFIDKIYIYG